MTENKDNYKTSESEVADDRSVEIVSSEQEPAEIILAEKENNQFPRVASDYEIIEQIGSGGMGTVYKARISGTKNIVAIKVLDEDLVKDKVARKRFQQEAEAISKLNSPNVISINSVKQTDAGAPYIVMEYHPGKNLSEIIAEHERMKPNRTLNIASQICEALRCAHERGIVHRDVKPSNVLIDENDTVKLSDFGIAKMNLDQSSKDLTRTGEVFGSPDYMSPEHCNGELISKRSDIYSFGCLLYEMVTGQPPFADGNPVRTVLKQLEEAPAPFPDRIRENPVLNSLESVILRCLEKDPKYRYQKIEDVLKDLTGIIRGESLPQYKQKPKKKKEYSARNIVAVSVGIAVLMFFAMSASAPLKTDLPILLTYFMVSNFVVFGGLYACYGVIEEQIEKISEWKDSQTGWWILFTAICFSLICLANLPTTTYVLGTVILWKLNVISVITEPGWMKGIELLSEYSHLFALTGLLVSLTGLGIFRSHQRVQLTKVLIQFFGIFGCAAMIVKFLIPGPFAEALNQIAASKVSRVPTFTRDMSYLSLFIDPDNNKTRVLTALYELRLKNYQASLGLLNKNLNFKQFSRQMMLTRIEVLRQSEDYDIALDEANQFISIYKTGGYGARGSVYESMGNYSKALLDYENDYLERGAIKAPPYSRINYVRMLCFNGKTIKALDILRTRSHQVVPDGRESLLAAVIIENLGHSSEALRMYRKALSEFGNPKEYPFTTTEQDRLLQLYIAYAYSRIGHSEESHSLERAKPMSKNDLIDTDLFKHSRLTLDW